MIKNYPVLFLAFLILPCLFNCSGNNTSYIKIEGFTQGTTYHITYGSPDSVNYHNDIKNLLATFDASLSTYQPNSIISRINNNDTTTKGNRLFAEVFEKAREMYLLSDGAFDITVGPLVKAYGFGKESHLVGDIKTDSILEFVGMDKIKYENNQIFKSDPRITLDVNAIAQGYSVDIVCQFLEEKGISDYMVEIGGEVKTKGLNPKGQIWRIGVDRPSEDNFVYNRQLFAIIQLEDRALATSGNYRKFKEENGEKFVHTLNPKTGESVKSNLLSVTVLADDCMTADALATTFMVIGLDKGKELALTLKNTDVYFIYSGTNGEYEEFFTPGFKNILQKIQ